MRRPGTPIAVLAMLAALAACDSSADGRGDADAGQSKVDVDHGEADVAVDGAPVDPRDQALIANGSFEDVAGASPKGWSCQYYGRGTPPSTLCELVEGGAVHGKRYLRIAPGVAAIASATLVGEDPAAHLGFELQARRGGAASRVNAASFYALARDGSGTPASANGRLVHPADPGGWQRVESLTVPIGKSTDVSMVLYNDDPSAVLEVDDVIVSSLATPRVASGHLLRAEHASAVACVASSKSTTIWLPLPIDHGVQVPLHLDLQLLPAGIAKVSYETDALGNLGARILVPPAAVARSFELRWKTVVLTREVKDSATLAKLYAAKLPTAQLAQWTAATPVVDTTHPPLQAEVSKLLAGATTAEAKMNAILAWSSAFIDPSIVPQSLDAKSVYDSRAGTCTGYANLAAAAGRIAGVPTRTVANYLVGLPQQTHAINEFYLGPTLGWRLVEPQDTRTVLPADYAVVMRVVPPEDEQQLSMGGNLNWSAPGVPSRTLSHPIDGDLGRCSFGYVSPAPFPSCPQCNNAASYQAPLLAPAGDTANRLVRARTLWQAALAKLVGSGALSVAEQQARAAALLANGDTELEALLAAIEALK
jgi:hypothetical protein